MISVVFVPGFLAGWMFATLLDASSPWAYALLIAAGILTILSELILYFEMRYSGRELLIRRLPKDSAESEE